MTKSIAAIGLALLLTSTLCVASEDDVILINAFEVPADKLQETISFWEKARDFLQTQPGYISTALHQSIKSDSRFQLVNVATWSSAKAFITASEKMRAQAGLPKIEGLIANPALYKVIRRD